jgi:peroxiredoxin Q/BCP
MAIAFYQLAIGNMAISGWRYIGLYTRQKVIFHSTGSDQRATISGQRTTDNDQRTAISGQRTMDNDQRTTKSQIIPFIMITLRAGDKAPVFTGVDQNGNKVSLSDYRGKKLVLYFYPEDDSPTCTIQACNLRDNYSLLKQHGFEIVGVSPDESAVHKNFQDKFQLPFVLLEDPSHKIMKKYGVWDEKQMFGHRFMGVLRTTFIIDEKGFIRKIFARPKTKLHSEEIIKLQIG